MGASQRTKGHDWERAVANAYRAKWPGATVRRSLQAHRPFEPDVVVEGDAPALARALWSEAFCSNGANEATVAVKLAQAERDVERWAEARGAGRTPPVGKDIFYRIPLVIWKRSGSRSPNVSIRLGPFLFCIGEAWQGDNVGHATIVITMPLKEFVAALP